MRKMVRSILVARGYCVETSADVKDALEKLEKSGFDMVITDLRMPDCDGFELLTRIKETWPDVGVVVMTGFGDAHTPDKARAKGADEYITKPFNAREIEVIVERVCWRRIVLQGKGKPTPAPDRATLPQKSGRPRKPKSLEPVV